MLIINYQNDEAQAGRLAEYRDEEFTDVIDRDEVKELPDSDVAIISLSGHGFVAAGIWVVGRGAATGRVRFKLEKTKWEEAERSVSDDQWMGTDKPLVHRLGTQDENRLILWLRTNMPQLAGHVDYLMNKLYGIPRYIEGLNEEEYYQFSMERDAVNNIFEMLDVDRKPLAEWVPSNGPRFLSGVPSSSVVEDVVIVDDCHNFLDWECVQNADSLGEYSFQSKDNQTIINIFNVNRKALEKAMGVDVVIFSDRWEGFVFVQYKMMEHAARSGATYKPNADTYEDIERIDAWHEKLKKAEAITHPNHYRMSQDAFFFKFFPRKQERNFNPKYITPSIILPFMYFKHILQSPDLGKGPNQGTALTFNNIGRKLETGTFQSLIGQGWIGTSGQSSELAKEVVTRSIADDRSVFLAWANHIKKP